MGWAAFVQHTLRQFGMKNESPLESLEADATSPSPQSETIDKENVPITGTLPTIQFQAVPIGGHFEFRGRRYRKLALSMAGDEDRKGNIFMDHMEVLPLAVR